MIEINDLKKSYKEIEVVNVPELNISKGESFGLVGNNGAGKTTLFRMILDLIRPNNGMVKSNDVVVSENEEWKKYTGSYLDEGFLIDFLTPDEYFNFIANIHGLSKGDVESFLNSFEEVFNGEIRGVKKYIRDLSKGNQKKVGIAAALMIDPEIIVLDEPFANLDPTTQIRLKKRLLELKHEKQVTMLISSHDLNHVTEVCERIVVLEKGNIIHDIKTSENTLKELEEYFTV
ncbi:ABC transporter ATP-binding protein [Fulvivirgaceae bacterium BMA10]|uniref:ABC transporter ATP-binding protein n=1 Tax=Splendidivirga corallicola TaxID=3051826 RepID=A0ABT8KIN3_9BACT|nr:ABC transporter ATP-binding protein [Fulvivirgaceae bacterium BMA10]